MKTLYMTDEQAQLYDGDDESIILSAAQSWAEELRRRDIMPDDTSEEPTADEIERAVERAMRDAR